MVGWRTKTKEMEERKQRKRELMWGIAAKKKELKRIKKGEKEKEDGKQLWSFAKIT